MRSSERVFFPASRVPVDRAGAAGGSPHCSSRASSRARLESAGIEVSGGRRGARGELRRPLTRQREEHTSGCDARRSPRRASARGRAWPGGDEARGGAHVGLVSGSAAAGWPRRTMTTSSSASTSAAWRPGTGVVGGQMARSSPPDSSAAGKPSDHGSTSTETPGAAWASRSSSTLQTTYCGAHRHAERPPRPGGLERVAALDEALDPLEHGTDVLSSDVFSLTQSLLFTACCRVRGNTNRGTDALS